MIGNIVLAHNMVNAAAATDVATDVATNAKSPKSPTSWLLLSLSFKDNIYLCRLNQHMIKLVIY